MARVPLNISHPHLVDEFSKNNSVLIENLSKGSVKKVWWVCQLGHEYEASPNSRTRPSGCPYCSNNKVLKGFNDLETLRPDIAKDWSSNNTLKPYEVQPNSNKKYLWNCGNGHEYTATAVNRSSLGRGCPYCAKRLAYVGESDLATTHPEVAKRWSPRNTRDIKTVKAKSAFKAWFVCDEGHEWEELLSSASASNASCRYCDGSRVLVGFNDLATVRPDLAKQWSDKNTIKPTEVLPASNIRVAWVCDLGHEWESICSNRLKTGCPYCSSFRVWRGFNDLATKRPDVAKDWAPENDKAADEVTSMSGYRAVWVCEKGHREVSTVCDRFECFTCRRGKSFSRVESEIEAFLDDLGVTYEKGNRAILEGKELDFVIESHKLAIEFNGLYWHSEAFVPSDYHKNKRDGAINAGYKFLTIWEDDWKNKSDIVKRMIAHKLGMSREETVYARKTNVVSLTHEQSSDFLDKYHIQGSANGSVYLGLEHDEKIVATMVFKKSGPGYTLERYATSSNVVGGHSKLLKYFTKNYSYDKITTFADLCISSGELYHRTGWLLDTELDPDYKYLYNSKLHHKFNYRKDRFKSDPTLLYEEGKTEHELAKMNKLLRVYDCGKLRFVYSK